MSIGMSISQFLKKTGIALNVVSNDQKALDLPAPYNLDAAAINGYISVQETANNTENTQRELHKRQYHESKLYRKCLAEAKKLFAEHLDLILIAFAGTAHPIIALGLDVKKQIVALRWMQKVRDFYEKVVSEQEILDKAVEFGLTLEKLTAGLDKAIEVEMMKAEHDRLKGEAQESIRKRDEELEILYVKMKGFIRICRLYAFKNHPQYLEKLGINVLSDGYKRKAKPVKEPTEPVEPEETEEPATT